jgi:hypothetical protein
MGRVRRSTREPQNDCARRVIDDLAHDHPVTPAELDTVEAFLMSLVHELFADAAGNQPGTTTPDAAPMPTPTHKRRNELLPEEI